MTGQKGMAQNLYYILRYKEFQKMFKMSLILTLLGV